MTSYSPGGNLMCLTWNFSGTCTFLMLTHVSPSDIRVTWTSDAAASRFEVPDGGEVTSAAVAMINVHTTATIVTSDFMMDRRRSPLLVQRFRNFTGRSEHLSA
jgi:hypothetical protein